ncbi:low molecular weight phosphatase family protein [Leucobacter massiliensis]|uniref:Phosphotyrosine protein phosphatase I domain-containing protein n=1 Tax=Leucobacter massiliensis TaxID=1686285 RepID=A0A2S9QN61_9MICO|nr:low molecular weight phosphatase family protein [Leucobacter massiliensis]PRI11019.1 hypothetical protein B4915_09105 [Leucobacter massiliensis]
MFELFDEAPKAGPFSILTVCTGNICRSPLAASLLRRELRGLPVSVTSAGTRAMEGAPMDAPMRRIAEELDLHDATRHQARQITAEAVAEADLVLALAREHRRATVELVPRANRTAFTLREFARLVPHAAVDGFGADPGDAGARMRLAVTRAAQARGAAAPPDSPEDDEVVDPFGSSHEVYERSRAQLVPAVRTVAEFLRAAAAPAGAGSAEVRT